MPSLNFSRSLGPSGFQTQPHGCWRFHVFCRFLIGKMVTIIFGEHFLEWIGTNKNKAVWVSNGFNILLPPGVSFHGRQLQQMISAARTRWRMRHLVLCVPMDMLAAWKYLRGKQVEDEEFSLHGLTRIEGLQHLELRANFNGSLLLS